MILQKLEAAFREGTEYTFDHLMDVIDPPTEDMLFVALGDLVRRGVLHQVYRVESRRGGGGIGDFESPADVPKVIHDWRTDTEMTVDANDVDIIFERETAHR